MGAGGGRGFAGGAGPRPGPRPSGPPRPRAEAAGAKRGPPRPAGSPRVPPRGRRPSSDLCRAQPAPGVQSRPPRPWGRLQGVGHPRLPNEDRGCRARPPPRVPSLCFTRAFFFLYPPDWAFIPRIGIQYKAPSLAGPLAPRRQPQFPRRDPGDPWVRPPRTKPALRPAPRCLAHPLGPEQGPAGGKGARFRSVAQ